MLGDYVILDKIGQGGLGVVFKAEHRRMRRMAAIKMLSATWVKDAEALKRFYREAEAAAKLSHPNVATIYDASEKKGLHYLVMEFLDGFNLAAMLERAGPLPIREAVECVLQAAQGLKYAHEHGIIHRDVKPGNMLLDREGVVKIIDMGLARLDERLGPNDAATAQRLTANGQVLGTCDFMAPEQWDDVRKVDPRADVYSLGCTLYYLLTGKLPYPRSNEMKILVAHQKDPIPSLCKIRAEVPRDLDAVFHKMVAKKPDDRYASMGAVIEALEKFVAAWKPAAPADISQRPSELKIYLDALVARGAVVEPEEAKESRPRGFELAADEHGPDGFHTPQSDRDRTGRRGPGGTFGGRLFPSRPRPTNRGGGGAE